MKRPLVLVFCTAMFFAVAHAQDATKLVPDTGEKPTSGDDVAVEIAEAKKQDEAAETRKTEPVEDQKPEEADETKKDEADETEKTEPVEGKKTEAAEAKKNEAGDEATTEPSTDLANEEAAKDEGEKVAKRAKPVNSETIRVFGWVEWCEVGDKKLRMKARLDTGAKTSSLHAEDVELFERDGVKWVKFTTETSDKKSVMIERPLKRIARIRKAGTEKLDERYVVELNFAIDGIQRRGEFTLSERDHMNYPVLVGRNLIGEFGLVDARRSFIAGEKIEL